MSTTIETLPKALQDRLEALERKREDLLKLEPTVRAAEAILERCRVTERDEIEIDTTDEILVTVYVKHWREITVLLRELAKAGYQQTRRPYDSYAYKTRRWYCGPIVVGGCLADGDAALCRCVQVGERKIEARVEPIYEWQCDNGEGNDGPDS